MVDLIQEWGRTSHRDFVISHIKAWERHSIKCFFFDASFLIESGMESKWELWLENVPLPAWARQLPAPEQAEVRAMAKRHYERFVLLAKERGVRLPALLCGKGSCAQFPGYAMLSPKEAYLHEIAHHGGEPGDELREDMIMQLTAITFLHTNRDALQGKEVVLHVKDGVLYGPPIVPQETEPGPSRKRPSSTLDEDMSGMDPL